MSAGDPGRVGATKTGTGRRRALAIGLLLLGACSIPERHDAVPRGEMERATVAGISDARFFPDTQPERLARLARDAAERERTAWIAAGHDGPLPPAHMLAISGGGDNGAFGAGLLVAWGESGTRPEFKLVTGVSTGALIAPFAFLGRDRDAQLARLYTTIGPKDILERRGLLAALYKDGMADNAPLFAMISRYVDRQMLDDVAREYAKGRLLLIGTTNLDARRPVLWNMGAIAGSRTPEALDLFRRILLTSAAIPGVFPPSMFDVTLDGTTYQEMHVDGGATAQMFLYPQQMSANPEFRRVDRPTHAWLIRNSRLDPEWSSVERRTVSVAASAISTMIFTSGLNDVLRIYNTAMRDGVDYNLAYIGPDFTMKPAEDFDPAFMQALYRYGYDKARAGYPWAKRPPWIPADATPRPPAR